MAKRTAAAGAPDARPGVEDRVVELTRRLAAVAVELGLSEIEVESGGMRVRVQRGPAPAAAPAGGPVVAASAAGADHGVVADAARSSTITIEAPMVGTFYRASSPTAEAYVSEGDVVKEGQILCIIEAMKLMNEIEAKASGRIVKILAENGQPVEYGQALFLLEPQ
jgi:acetyl-CoA carboxylase biotin carboxyl carrier protein